MKMKRTNRVLAVYPNQWGVAFAIFEGAKRLLDFGVAYVQPADNEKILARVEKLITFHQPNVMVIRAITQDQKTVSKRIRTLLKRVAKCAKDEDLKTRHVSRTDVQKYFCEGNHCSKYDIAQKLIKHYPALESYEFPVRKRWLAEHHYTGIFDAVAMGRVYYRNMS